MDKLIQFELYNRKDVHDIFAPGTNFTQGSGTWGLQGIVRVEPNKHEYVLFVTKGREQAYHKFEDLIDNDGTFFWESQPSQTFSSPSIKEFLNNNDVKVHLFYRTSKDLKNYVYVGLLSYSEHDKFSQCPVKIKWKINNFDNCKFESAIYKLEKGDINEENYPPKYFCTKKVWLYSRTLINRTIEIFRNKGQNIISLDEIYRLLVDKFNIKSFNKENLSSFLKSDNNFVSYKTINELYLAYNSKEIEDESISQLFLQKKCEKILIKNGINSIKTFLSCDLQSLSEFVYDNADYLQELQETYRRLHDDEIKFSINDITDETNDSNSDSIVSLGLSVRATNCLINNGYESKYDLLKYHGEKLRNMGDNTRNEILKCIDQLKRRDESFKNHLLDVYIENIHINNYPLCIDTIFSQNIYLKLNEINLNTIEDLVQADRNKTYPIFLSDLNTFNVLEKLDKDFRIHVNELVLTFLQNKLKNGEPNRLWERDADILSKRNQGYTLQSCGELYNITREGIRCREIKFLSDFKQIINDKIFRAVLIGISNDRLYIKPDKLYKIFDIYPDAVLFLIKNVNSDFIEYDEDYNIFTLNTEWLQEIEKKIENIQSTISSDEYKYLIDETFNTLSNEGYNIEIEIINEIFKLSFKENGNFYTKHRLNLLEKYRIIIDKYFNDGINIYNESDLNKFQECYEKLFGGELTKSSHALQARISSICILVDKGKYKLNANVDFPEIFICKLREFINNRDFVFMNDIFYEFESKFDELGITNRYYMQSLLKIHLPEYYYTKDYVSVSKKDYYIYDEILSFLKNSERVVSIEELHKEFFVSNVVLFNALNDERIVNLRRKYIYADNIKYDQSVIDKVETIMNSLVDDGQIRHSNELYLKLVFACPEFLEKYNIEGQFELFSIISSIYKEKFTFKRPFFSRNDINIKGRNERLIEYINEHETLLIDDILEFVSDNKLFINNILDFIDGLDDYIFKNAYEIEKMDDENIDDNCINNIDKILTEACLSDSFISSKNFNGYYLLDEKIEWNCWKLYSLVKKFSNNFKVITQSKVFKNKNTIIAYPIFIKKTLPVENYDDFIELLRKSSNLDDFDFIKYLEIKGIN